MKKFNLILGLIVIPLLLSAQSVEGLWKTIDDETGNAKSIVKVYKANGKLYGEIVKLIENKDPNAKCTECPGELKNKPLRGMRIIYGLEKKRGKWKGDDGILDPEKGKYYNCKIWAESDTKLNVRGYIGPLYRTQNWIRYQ
ncbi:MAG: DUF2147 domain-containing protein [Bacteroidota bacterium]|nr:DUF2147 domain-containing protein [Bacteroidota bacterium]